MFGIKRPSIKVWVGVKLKRSREREEAEAAKRVGRRAVGKGVERERWRRWNAR